MSKYITNEELKRIHDDVLAGRSTLEDEARRHGKSAKTLSVILSYHGYGTAKRRAHRLIDDARIEEAYRRHMAGEAYAKLAAEYYLDDTTLAKYVRSVCIERGWPMPDAARKELTPELMRRVNEEYQAGLKSVAQICREYRINTYTVCKCVDEMGGPRRIPAIQRVSRISDETARQMMEEYRQPEVNLDTLSAKYGASPTTIRERIMYLPGYKEAARLKQKYKKAVWHDYTPGHKRRYALPLSEERKAELLNMYLQPGMSLEKLTAKTGVSGRTLQQIFAGNSEYKRTAALRNRSHKAEKGREHGIQEATDS